MAWISLGGNRAYFSSRNKPKITNWLSLILRGGVILSALVIGLGLLLFLLTGQSGYTQAGNNAQQYITFHDHSTRGVYFPTTPTEIWQGVVDFKPFAIIMLGISLLTLTPVLNVALVALGFLRQRDRALALISFFVLSVLVLSFFLGNAGL
jgi:uncharacterized membrane protein